ncbi:MAG: glycosyltransferase family 2 protein [Candidatus Bathyarchaeota archaeon]|nr:glycosyltransferase family 2 protein [Candidatus Bathyarchaeota archaeon]
MQGIDVVVLTMNSEHLLSKCLASIYANVPVKNLIVIDGYSTDATLKIVAEFNRKHGNVKVLRMNGSRARAREKAVQQVNTEWFMFVDSDVILSKNWFKQAAKYAKPGVGAVWGVNIDVIPNVKDKNFIKLQRLIARQCFALRGGTHDTLIRRSAVADIKIPELLHVYEDAFIMNWIKQKGYRVVVGDDVYCLHFKPPANWSLENAVSQAILEFRCGLVYSHMYVYALYYPFFMFYWFLQLSIQSVRSALSV